MKFNSEEQYKQFVDFDTSEFIFRNKMFESYTALWDSFWTYHFPLLLDYDYYNQPCKIQTLIDYRNFFKNEFKEMMF